MNGSCASAALGRAEKLGIIRSYDGLGPYLRPAHLPRATSDVVLALSFALGLRGRPQRCRGTLSEVSNTSIVDYTISRSHVRHVHVAPERPRREGRDSLKVGRYRDRPNEGFPR